MQEPQVFEPTISEELYARALGWEMLRFARAYDEQALARRVESDAIALLDKIRAVLDDDSLDDPACFHRIEAMVDAFHQQGLSTTRHGF